MHAGFFQRPSASMCFHAQGWPAGIHLRFSTRGGSPVKSVFFSIDALRSLSLKRPQQRNPHANPQKWEHSQSLTKTTLSSSVYTRKVYFRTNKDESKSWLAMSNRTQNFCFHWHPVADSIPARAKVSKLEEREWRFFVSFSFLPASASVQKPEEAVPWKCFQRLCKIDRRPRHMFTQKEKLL